MTVEEFYNWAKKNGYENKTLLTCAVDDCGFGVSSPIVCGVGIDTNNLFIPAETVYEDQKHTLTDHLKNIAVVNVRE